MLTGLAGALLVVGTHVYAPAAHARERPPDWWKAQKDVVALLAGQRTGFAEVLAGVAALKPRTGQEAMFKLNVLMRAGMNKEAMAALGELKELCPDLGNRQIQLIYHSAFDDFSSWGLARSVVEVFAQNISEINLHNRLLKQFLASGWTVDEVDGWLAGMPPGDDNFWVKERLFFLVTHGRGEQLVEELSGKVRKRPEDVRGAGAFLDALVRVRHIGRGERDLSWMIEAVRPRRATEAEGIASRLKALSNWAAAITFYRQAIETPLTEKEVEGLATRCSVYVPGERLRAMFGVSAREGMAQCLLKLGRNDEAQEWMVDAADMREKHGLGLNALFAGQVQGASGRRTVEGRIKDEEKESENDPAYWSRRAAYYRGRKESDLEEEALKRGLALAAPLPEPDPRLHRPHMDWRSWLLRDYALFLARANRAGEAVAFLRKEIKDVPSHSGSAATAARLLTSEFEKLLGADDEVLWNWLADRPTWEYTEEHLLWRMLKNAKPDDLGGHFSRAEELAKGSDPSRARTLGWIMNRMRHPRRSIPLLEDAVARARDKELKKRATFTLFESYLDTNDWRRAEEIFPEASKRLTPREVSEWHSRIAVAAAKVAARADAMRIWKAAVNVNPSETRGLGDLVKAGLRNELTDFYREMQRKMPSSEFPARALRQVCGEGR